MTIKPPNEAIKTEDSAHIVDFNGFVEIPENPISKSGVFEYLGAEIGAPEPNKVYKVLRSDEELSRPETMDSFRGKPFTIAHTMLGDKGLAVEKKGADGTVGDRLTFKDGTLYANLHVWTDKIRSFIQQKKDAGEKVELSAGYYAKYDFTPGTWKGKAYDAVQRFITGNHLAALSGAGRCGETVSVLDGVMPIYSDLIFTYDHEVTDMALTAEEVKALFADALAPIKATMDAQAAQLSAMQKTMDEAETDDDEDKKKATEDEDGDEEMNDNESKKDNEDGDDGDDEKKATEDADDDDDESKKKDDDDSEKEKATEDAKMIAKQVLATQDAVAKKVTAELHLRDELIKLATPLVGTFDHAGMGAEDVAKYAAEKLGLSGHAETALRTAAKLGTKSIATQDAAKRTGENQLKAGDFN